VPKALRSSCCQHFPTMWFCGPSGTAPKALTAVAAGLERRPVHRLSEYCWVPAPGLAAATAPSVVARSLHAAPGAVPDALSSITAAWLASPGPPTRRSRNSRSSASAGRAWAAVRCGQSWPILGQKLTKNGHRIAKNGPWTRRFRLRPKAPGLRSVQMPLAKPDMAHYWAISGPNPVTVATEYFWLS
jgi:hypothetical protein